MKHVHANFVKFPTRNVAVFQVYPGAIAVLGGYALTAFASGLHAPEDYDAL